MILHFETDDFYGKDKQTSKAVRGLKKMRPQQETDDFYGKDKQMSKAVIGLKRMCPLNASNNAVAPSRLN